VVWEEAARLQVLERLLVWPVIGLASRGSWPLSRCWWSPPFGFSRGEEGGSDRCWSGIRPAALVGFVLLMAWKAPPWVVVILLAFAGIGLQFV
jgi:hypothetical protein